jgi:hypothetical protein
MQRYLLLPKGRQTGEIPTSIGIYILFGLSLTYLTLPSLKDPAALTVEIFTVSSGQTR